jgi:hypothetical protein
MKAAKKSSKQIAAEAVGKLRTFLDSVEALPARGGKVHVSAVAEAIGIDRQTLYKNPAARQLLEEAVEKKGLRGLETRDDQEDSTIARLEQRISELEAKNSTLLAEKWKLAEELKKLRQVEALLEQGRRVIP